MKNRFIAVLFILPAVASLTQAQITMVQDDVIGLKGSTQTFVTRSSSDYTGIAAIVAATGTGRTWDLTNRTYTFNDTNSITYLDYSAGYAGASSFPSSNLVHRQINTTATSTTTNWSYYTISSTAMNFLGVHNISGTQATTTAYNTPVQAVKFPASYNTSWTTASSITSQGFTSNVTFEYLVDGEGTVITPEGSFPCLRLKLKLTTSVFGFSTVSYVYTFLNKTRTFATIATDGNNTPNSLVYWSQISGGQTGSAPSAPTLASPADGATGISTSPTLSWVAVTGATSYNLQVATSSTFATTVVNQTGITTTSFALTTALANNTQYFWRVSATNSAGTSAYPLSRSFTTVVALPTVTTSSASSVSTTSATVSGSVNPNGASTTAYFEWGTSSTLSTSTATASQSIGSGTSAVSVTANLTGLSANTTYYYRVVGQNSGGTVRGSIVSFTTAVPSSVEQISAIPTAFELTQNYPNPFNPSTSIQLSVASAGRVTLKVFDMLGHDVASIVDEYLTPGLYRITWDAYQLPSGHYLYRATMNGLVQTKRMTLLK
jgi:hypothetical protein